MTANNTVAENRKHFTELYLAAATKRAQELLRKNAKKYITMIVNGEETELFEDGWDGWNGQVTYAGNQATKHLMADSDLPYYICAEKLEKQIVRVVEKELVKPLQYSCSQNRTWQKDCIAMLVCRLTA